MVAPADPVVSTEWLEKHLQDVAIVDIRGRVDQDTVEERVEVSHYIPEYDSYLAGHIPGASFFSWVKDGVDLKQPVPVQLQTDSDIFAAEMEAKGVGTDRPVVVYDGGSGLLAARLWWALMYHGHPAPLVLEGGFARWRDEGRPVELSEPCPLKVYADFQPRPRPEIRATADELLAALASPDAGSKLLLLDTRNAMQYDGQVRRSKHGGRIPGAAKLPRGALLDPATGLPRPLQEQRRLLEAAGVPFSAPAGEPEPRVVAYCNGGVASCTAALALHRLGYRNWASYDGSWNEWGNRDDVPIEEEWH